MNPTRLAHFPRSGARRPLAVHCAALVLFATLGCSAMGPRMMAAAAERQREAQAEALSMLEDDALQVFLCGTGSPLPDAEAAAACTVVVAGGEVYVVDVGPGSQEVAQLGLIPTGALGGVFLTHFHSDHIGELGEWAVQSWIAGRKDALHVYGPEGVEDVVAGFKRAYRLDDAYRIEHHGEENLPPSATEWKAHTLPSRSGPGTRVLEKGDLVVTAFAVDHRPVEPALGYRFDYRGRSVVVSGDTDASSNLIENARGADLLVHEALLKSVIEQLSDQLGRSGDARRQRLAADILDYHTSPSEAAEAAKAAGVDTLVLTHLVPTLPSAFRKTMFLRDVESGDVDVILGEDGMRFRLPAASDAIEMP